ncbi:MAG: YcxB family protein [Acidobacteria bacterium]|nr:YcxB family protein [Acidobacteriota bacterium]
MDLEQRISIQVLNEEADFSRLLWRTRRRAVIITIFLVCLVLGSFSFYASLSTPADPKNDLRLAFYITSILAPLFVVFVVYAALKTHAKKAAAAAELVTMTFDNEGVEIDGPRASSKTRWAAYKGIVETQDDFIFYIDSNICYGVPKRFFRDSGQIEIVSSLISNNFRA